MTTAQSTQPPPRRAMTKSRDSLDSTGRTKVRHVRIPDELWLPACESAREDGATISELVRHLLRNHLAGEGSPRG